MKTTSAHPLTAFQIGTLKSGLKNPFTLIELLVVVAIIAVLASMLLPALSRARAMARDTACLNNLGQIGKVFMLYADDFDGQIPFDGQFNGGSAQGLFREAAGPRFPMQWWSSGMHFSNSFGEAMDSYMDKGIAYCPFYGDAPTDDWNVADDFWRYQLYIGNGDGIYPSKGVFPDHRNVTNNSHCVIPDRRRVGEWPDMPLAGDIIYNDRKFFASHPASLASPVQLSAAAATTYSYGDPDHNFVFPDGSAHGARRLRGPYFFGPPVVGPTVMERFILFQQ